MQLASPEGFTSDPELVVEWYRARRRAVAEAAPDSAHRAVATRVGLANITQNVDNLLEQVGARDVIYLHGTLMRDRCHAECGYIEEVDLTDPPGLRPGPRCDNRLRPDVIWFGEMLPQDAFVTAQQMSSQCDVLLVIGTSAVVYPAAS